MQSAGLRTRQRGRFSNASVDDSVSMTTLHTIDDGQPLSPVSHMSPRTTNRSSRALSPELIIQRPDPPLPSPSAPPSSNPSLIIQNFDEPLSPGTAPDRRTTRRKKIEQLVPDYRPNTSATNATNLTSISSSSAEKGMTDATDIEFEDGSAPPRFTIDLSRPPRERYDHVAPHFVNQRKVLQRISEDLLRDLLGKRASLGRRIGKRLLRKVPSREEQEELEGIAQAWGVELHLLVALNVLLDSLMGCTSGGVRVKDESSQSKATKKQPRKGRSKLVQNMLDPPLDNRGHMLHFRTLDWSMDPLRRIVCEFEYVAFQGGDVIARAVTYFGFVGVLTGVRKGLSISLNFRPLHDASSLWKRAAFRLHQALVLLGFRQSIASTLRDYLLPSANRPDRPLPSLVDIERELPSKRTTVAYLIFSDGARTTTMEKDRKTAIVRSASDFIVAANHDAADDRLQQGADHNMDGGIELMDISHRDLTPVANSRHASPAAAAAEDQRQDLETGQQTVELIGLESIVEESKYRKGCISRYWTETKARRGGPSVRLEDVIDWLSDPALCNDETHYACIMDPTKGEIAWLKWWITPLRTGDW